MKIEIDIADYEILIRENERMKTALRSVMSYADSASVGFWRQSIYDLAENGVTRSD